MIHDLIDQAIQAERLGRFDEARDKLRKAIALGDSLPVLDSRLRLGKLLVQGGQRDLTEARTVLSQARKQAEQEGAPRQAMAALHLLALLELAQGNLDEASRLLDESPALNQVSAPGGTLGQFFHYRGLVEADRGRLNFAERMLFRAHQIYREAHHETGLAEVCDSLGNLLVRSGHSHAALAFALKSLELKRRFGDRFGEAISLGTLGRVFLLLARYEEAVQALTEQLVIARELDDNHGVGITLNYLGEVALMQKDFDAAARHYGDSLATEAGPYNATHAELGLASVHLFAGRLDDANAATDRAGDLLAANQMIAGLTDFLTGVRGGIAWRRGDFVAGELLLTEAIKALEQHQQPLRTVPFLYQLRDLHQARGDTAKAVAVMTRTIDLLAECGSEQGVADVEEWLRTVDAPGLTRLALQRHVPGYLVEDILSGRMKRPRPRRQVVTVLFCDVRNYTTLSEGLDPERVVELLNEWFTVVTRTIRRHHGIVDKFIGDAIMAVFGVPEPGSQDAADAVRAALEMRNALASLNLRRDALNLKQIEVGIGINTGEAVVGFIGSHSQQSFAAIGDVTNTASRIESKTRDFPGCDILISESTQEIQRRHGVAETEYMGAVHLKGKGQPVPVYQVLGPLEAKS